MKRLALVAAWLKSQVELRDVLVFGGIALMAWGASLVYSAAGLVVAGALLFYMGVKKWA